MRRLYWVTRKTCGASSALELKTRSGVLLMKNDKRLIDAGITGPTELLLRVLPNPDTFTIFVQLPDRQEQSTFEIGEVRSCMKSNLYTILLKTKLCKFMSMHAASSMQSQVDCSRPGLLHVTCAIVGHSQVVIWSNSV